MRNRKLTVAPIRPGDCTGIAPEFGRLADVQRVYGLRRGTVYNLIRAGRIKAVLLRATGQKSGIRLIDLASVRDYIGSQMEAA